MTDIILCLLTAVLYTLSFPKFDWGWLAWFSLVPFLIFLRKNTPMKRTLILSWACGLAGSLGTLYWIYPTCRTAHVNPIGSVFVTLALSLYMSLYWIGFAYALRKLGQNGPSPDRYDPLLAAALWTVLEWIRSHILTGFPWNLMGYTQYSHPALIQISSWTGVYGVSFLIVLGNALGVALLSKRNDLKQTLRFHRMSVAAFIGLLLLNLLLNLGSFSSGREPVTVSILQGNIDQYKKWDDNYEREIVNTYTRLALDAAQKNPDLIIWPETAVPGWIPGDTRYLEWLKGLCRQTGTHMLVGAPSQQDGNEYNAVFFLSPDGVILDQYRKMHLVPFGERIPFKPILARFFPVLNELGEFDSSKDWTVFRAPWGKFGVNICFEAGFPGIVRGFVKRGAEVTINMTNDGWYLTTAGPYQHFATNIFRAVETRTYVVRAANTGFSTIIAPDGRIRTISSLMREETIDGEIVPSSRRTFYTLFGDAFTGMCAVFLGLSVWLRRKMKSPSGSVV
ncbi:MAG TPA: apolipoprotein N-acyltransferase [Elusimicrobiota bacterium]|nr:apolipoprotein N-acyltransferase [Elusimicrobiota bacterium]